MVVKLNYCIWTKRIAFDEIWDTKCGETYIIIYDSPINNGYKYCPYCGEIIKEVANETIKKND